MPLLVRKVGKHHFWLKAPALQYLDKNDSPADAVSDLRTKENRISVYVVADDKSNLNRILSAIVIGGQSVDHTAYIVFDSRIVSDAGIEIEEVPGKTSDKTVNPLHRDLVLTGKKMVALAVGILREGEEVTQILRERMVQLIHQGIDAGELPEDLRKKLPAKK